MFDKLVIVYLGPLVVKSLCYNLDGRDGPDEVKEFCQFT
jgi:hypothetical protein